MMQEIDTERGLTNRID